MSDIKSKSSAEAVEPYAEAMGRYRQGQQPSISTGICGNMTVGYGQLDENGYWEFPLLPHPFVPCL